ncbi:MAG TPA: hypothetical protein VNB64_09185 [Solirubrobacteraceae bacterium]|nr:hypothetical protein [Solirubrobacteraceae bacterium]
MRRLCALIPLLALLAVPVAEAGAAKLHPDVQRITYRYPVELKRGTNVIRIKVGIPKPQVPGYVVRIEPNLVRRDGTVPPTDQIHLHHAVWLSTRAPSTNPNVPGFGTEIFFATGEEKTIVTIPRPYGYPVRPSDTWILNDMIHDLTDRGARLFITYTVDFVPAASRLGRRLKPVTPVWMDVEDSAYPVFDVIRGSGRNGRYRYPNMAPGAYAGRATPVNELTLPRGGTLVAFGGHVHPGGLWTDLALRRNGRSTHLFRSEARYFGGRAPVSWDLGMTVTPRDWRVRVRAGDVLRISATYDTRHASWYESMGIMFGWLAADATGRDPFTQRIATRGRPTHGHLPENDDFGGRPTRMPDPASLPGGAAPGGVVPISNFRYRFGDLSGAGAARNPPTIPAGSSLEFVNQDTGANVFHTVTGCRAPCNRSTGIGYPLADGTRFDSGNLGFGPAGFTAAANRDSWRTPSSLRPGTYAYLCRVHPYMRGAFRVVPVR